MANNPAYRLEALRMAVQVGDPASLEKNAEKFSLFIETGSFAEQKEFDLKPKSGNTPDKSGDVVDSSKKSSTRSRKK